MRWVKRRRSPFFNCCAGYWNFTVWDGATFKFMPNAMTRAATTHCHMCQAVQRKLKSPAWRRPMGAPWRGLVFFDVSQCLPILIHLLLRQDRGQLLLGSLPQLGQFDPQSGGGGRWIFMTSLNDGTSLFGRIFDYRKNLSFLLRCQTKPLFQNGHSFFRIWRLWSATVSGSKRTSRYRSESQNQYCYPKEPSSEQSINLRHEHTAVL